MGMLTDMAIYYNILVMKFVVAKVDFEPELGKKQDVCFLLNDENRLLGADTVEVATRKAKEIFGQELEVGKEFFEDGEGEEYYFANLRTESLPEGWKVVSYRELDDESCDDYEALMVAIEKLGYIAE